MNITLRATDTDSGLSLSYEFDLFEVWRTRSLTTSAGQPYAINPEYGFPMPVRLWLS